MLLLIYNLRDAADLMIVVLAVLAIWVAYHKIPQKGIKADKSTDTVVTAEDSYTSPNLSIQLSYSHYDTGILDWSNSGKHIKYGTQIIHIDRDMN